jgi:hypothetical protein
MPLTDVEIREAKAALRPYKIRDEGWLFLLVKPSGSKLWQMGYRFAGKETTLSIGAYPDISLKDAREARDNAKRVLLAGSDPGEQKRLDKLARDTRTAITFKVVAADYRDKLRREGRAAATLDKLDWLLALIMPKLGERHIGEN